MDTITTGIDWIDAMLNPAPMTPEQEAHLDALAALDRARDEERAAMRRHLAAAARYGYGRHTDATRPEAERTIRVREAAERLVEETRLPE